MLTPVAIVVFSVEEMRLVTLEVFYIATAAAAVVVHLKVLVRNGIVLCISRVSNALYCNKNSRLFNKWFSQLGCYV